MKISTHTSRVGCDLNSWCLVQHHIISTHTSRVGCDKILEDAGVEVTFLLTHPVWDVTLFPKWKQPIIFYFYSHIPCGMWHHQRGTDCRWVKFLLTHPVWDVTFNPVVTASYCIFLLTHPVWDVTIKDEYTAYCFNDFYSHIPCGMWPLYIVYFNHIIPIYYRMDL